MTLNYDLAGDVTGYNNPATVPINFTITSQISAAQRITQVTSSLNDATLHRPSAQRTRSFAKRAIHPTFQ